MKLSVLFITRPVTKYVRYHILSPQKLRRYRKSIIIIIIYKIRIANHRRQPRRGCRGRIPTNILVGGVINGNVPTNIRGGTVVE